MFSTLNTLAPADAVAALLAEKARVDLVASVYCTAYGADLLREVYPDAATAVLGIVATDGGDEFTLVTLRGKTGSLLWAATEGKLSRPEVPAGEAGQKLIAATDQIATANVMGVGTWLDVVDMAFAGLDHGTEVEDGFSVDSYLVVDLDEVISARAEMQAVDWDSVAELPTR